MRKIESLIPTTYADAARLLEGDGKFGPKWSHRLNANTRVERPHGQDDISIVLHHTAVVTFRKNGEIVLNSGGWRTTTTKARINAALPTGYHVYQDKREWFVQTPGQQVKYQDGMTLQPRRSLFERVEV